MKWLDHPRLDPNCIIPIGHSSSTSCMKWLQIFTTSSSSPIGSSQRPWFHPPTSTRSNRSPAPQSHPSPCTPKILLAPYKIPSVFLPQIQGPPQKNTCDMTHSVDGRNPALGMYRTLWILEQIWPINCCRIFSIKNQEYELHYGYDMYWLQCELRRFAVPTKIHMKLS